METFEVKILGQRYKMKSEEGQAYIEELTNYVNDAIKNVQSNLRSTTQNLMVFAAINIADDLFKQREREKQAKREVRERIRHILKLIKKNDKEEQVDD